MTDKTTPISVAMYRAAAALLDTVAMPDWAGWIVYMLEILDNQAARQAGDFDAVLESVETAIAIRRADGRW